MAVTLSLFAGAGAQFFDNNGNVLSGGKIYTYQAGTTTPLAVYTTNSESAFHTNPIILDAAGRVPSGGEIWLQLGVGYKFVLRTSSDVLIATYDNIPSSAQPPAANDADSIMYEQGYTVTAGSFVVGKIYRIVSVGTTDFTLIGAVNNTVGTHFIATGVGTGTGTAELSQTVETKLRETVSVKDFGAVGDGVTDDTAAFQNAIDAASFGSILLLGAGDTYLVTAPLILKGSIRIQGQGTDNTRPQFAHFAQILSMHDGATFSFDGAAIDKAYQDSGIQFINLKTRSNRSVYPNSICILASKTYGGCTIDGCHFSNYGTIAALATTYGFLINNSNFVSADYGVRADCTFVPLGVPDGLYQTNVLNIRNTIIQTQTGIGVDIYGPGNTINIEGSTIENNAVGIRVREYAGAAVPGALDIFQALLNVNIKDSYFEKNITSHIQIGNADGTGIVTGVEVTGNNINKDLSASECIKIYACTQGFFNNQFRNGAGVTPYLVQGALNSVSLFLGAGQIYNGNFNIANNCSVEFAVSADHIITTLFVEPGNANVRTGNEVTRYYAGNSTQPLGNLEDVRNFVRFFSSQYQKAGVGEVTVQIKNTGDSGRLERLPIGITKLNILRNATSTTTPQISGVLLFGPGSVVIDGFGGGIELLNNSTSINHYYAENGATLAISNAAYNYGATTVNSSFARAINGATVCLASTVTNIGTQPTFGCRADKAIVYRGGSTVAGTSGDNTVNGGTVIA